MSLDSLIHVYKRVYRIKAKEDLMIQKKQAESI